MAREGSWVEIAVLLVYASCPSSYQCCSLSSIVVCYGFISRIRTFFDYKVNLLTAHRMCMFPFKTQRKTGTPDFEL